MVFKLAPGWAEEVSMETAQRFNVHEQTSIEVYGRSANIEAVLVNLSVTGARLTWDGDGIALQQGDLVCLTIHLQKIKKSHRVSAEVVWQKGNSTGVNFISPELLMERFRQKTGGAKRRLK